MGGREKKLGDRLASFAGGISAAGLQNFDRKTGWIRILGTITTRVSLIAALAAHVAD